jgi:hypothetical protein
MALIPLEPEPRPRRFRFMALYCAVVLLTVLITGLCAWWQS